MGKSCSLLNLCNSLLIPLVVWPCEDMMIQFCLAQKRSSCNLSQTAAFSMYTTYLASTFLNVISSTLLGMLQPPEPNLDQSIVSPESSITTFPATLPFLLALTFNCSLEQPVINSKSSKAESVST